MATFDYAEIATDVDELLLEFGQAITLTTVTAAGTYNTATGVITPTTSTETGTGAVLDWSSRYIDGETVKIGDRRLLLSPKTTAGAAITAPAVGTTVAIGGVTYTVTRVMPLNPGGTVVIYECNLRGA